LDVKPADLPAHIVPIADDIYQIHLPLPFLLNRVNVYLLRGDHGWSIIDTGINQPESQAIWESTFAVLKVVPANIEQIILTHTHPDHYGMAGWLQARSGTLPPVKLSPLEAEQARTVWTTGDSRDDLIRQQMLLSSAPTDLADAVVSGIRDTRRMTFPQPERVELIQPNSTVRIGNRMFKAIHAPGHSEGQLLFYDEADKLLLSGDHVLMKITPNIGLWVTGDHRPLQHFLASLHEVRDLDVRIALPGHKSLIHDWRGRIDELLHHHDDRLNRVLDAAQHSATVYEVAASIFDFSRLTHHEMRFALVESLAHLEYLREENQLTRDEPPASAWRYSIK
jgi:glyoxylase-like metal-dependent hydrolase (beta-lactamase superfamily II)